MDQKILFCIGILLGIIIEKGIRYLICMKLPNGILEYDDFKSNKEFYRLVCTIPFDKIKKMKYITFKVKRTRIVDSNEEGGEYDGS